MISIKAAVLRTIGGFCIGLVFCLLLLHGYHEWQSGRLIFDVGSGFVLL